VIQRFHAVFRVDVEHVDGLSVFGIISIGPDIFELIGIYLGDREVFKHFVDSFGSSSLSGDCENHGRQLLWNFFNLELFPDPFEFLIRVGDIPILVGTVAVQEGSSEPSEHHVLPEAFEKIECSCDPCVTAEGNQSLMVGIFDVLVVDEPDVLLDEGVVGLGVFVDGLDRRNLTFSR
jgi:hypothetical protein